jgi:hypothetical protein
MFLNNPQNGYHFLQISNETYFESTEVVKKQMFSKVAEILCEVNH